METYISNSTLIDVYERGSKAAFKNCHGLLNDANILYENGRYASAYALVVLCAEEFSKSFLYKCYSSGVITDPEFERDILKHDEKLYHVTHAFSIFWTIARPAARVAEAMEHDSHFEDHSQHVFLKVLVDTQRDSIAEVVRIFKTAHTDKLNALYVDIKGTRLVTPEKEITQAKCKEILDFLNIVYHGFEIFLDDNAEQFKKRSFMLSPDLLHGTMKSNLSKYLNSKRTRTGAKAES